MALARGYAAMYGHDYVVVRIADEGVFDVEPRQSLDEVGAFGIVGIATPPDH
jgi:hypothetical protein